MPEKHLFEYAVIRVVPRVEREEFLNAGVILYCKRLKFLECRYALDERRLAAFTSGLDMEEVRGHIEAFRKICAASKDGGPIAQLEDMAERFRWLTATRSTIVQTSKVHPGLCSDPKGTLEKLFREMVG